MQRRRFSNKEIHNVRAVFALVNEFMPEFGFEMRVDGHVLHMGDEKAGGFFRVATKDYGIEMCPIYVMNEGKKESGCWLTVRDYVNKTEIDSRHISCRVWPLEVIFARAVASVAMLTVARQKHMEIPEGSMEESADKILAELKIRILSELKSIMASRPCPKGSMVHVS